MKHLTKDSFPRVILIGLSIWVALSPSFSRAQEKRPSASGSQPKTRDKAAPVPPRFTPEERARRRQIIKDRLTRQISDLEKKKSDGAISDEERVRLERLQLLASRFRRPAPAGTGTVLGTPANNPGKPVEKPK